MSINPGGRVKRGGGRQLVGTAAVAFVVAFNIALAACASELKWLNDIEHAKQMASAQHKDLLINFTGLKWCENCIRLEQRVFENDAFAPADNLFVLVRLDYPGGVPRLPQEPRAPQPTWLDTYGNVEYPTIFLADATGKPYATTGNLTLEAKEYYEHIEELHAVHKIRDDTFTKAAKSKGLEKAKAFAEGLKAMEKGFADNCGGSNADPLLLFYREQIDFIVQADGDNGAGLRSHFEKIARRDKDRSERESLHKELDEAYAKNGAKVAIQVLDDRIRTVKSSELRKQMRRARLTYLEWDANYADALQYAKQLAADDSFTTQEKVEIRRRIGWNLRQMNQTDDAIATYDAIIADVKPSDPHKASSIESEKADVYWYAKRYQESLESHTEAIRLIEPNTDEWLNEQAWQIRILAKLGQVKEALSAYDALSKSSAASPEVRVAVLAQMALILKEQGSIEAARDAAKQAQQLLDQTKASVPNVKESQDDIDKVFDAATLNSTDVKTSH